MKRKYNIIYADPPWHYRDKARSGKRGADYKYRTMPLLEIARLPVHRIAADNCALFLWVTFPLIFDVKLVIDMWGFKYKNRAFNWVKKNPKKDTWYMGLGNYVRGGDEVCLLATRGRLKRQSASVSSIVETPTLKPHSRKPAVVRDRIVQLFGDLPRIELFATEVVAGWDATGYEVDRMDIRDVLSSAFREMD